MLAMLFGLYHPVATVTRQVPDHGRGARALPGVVAPDVHASAGAADVLEEFRTTEQVNCGLVVK